MILQHDVNGMPMLFGFPSLWVYPGPPADAQSDPNQEITLPATGSVSVTLDGLVDDPEGG